MFARMDGAGRAMAQSLQDSPPTGLTNGASEALRNYIYIILENKKHLCSLEVGNNEYYMYIRTPMAKAKIKGIAERYGLYLDPRG